MCVCACVCVCVKCINPSDNIIAEYPGQRRALAQLLLLCLHQKDNDDCGTGEGKQKKRV